LKRYVAKATVINNVRLNDLSGESSMHRQ